MMSSIVFPPGFVPALSLYSREGKGVASWRNLFPYDKCEKIIILTEQFKRIQLIEKQLKSEHKGIKLCCAYSVLFVAGGIAFFKLKIDDPIGILAGAVLSLVFAYFHYSTSNKMADSLRQFPQLSTKEKEDSATLIQCLEEMENLFYISQNHDKSIIHPQELNTRVSKLYRNLISLPETIHGVEIPKDCFAIDANYSLALLKANQELMGQFWDLSWKEFDLLHLQVFEENTLSRSDEDLQLNQGLLQGRSLSIQNAAANDSVSRPKDDLN